MAMMAMIVTMIKVKIVMMMMRKMENMMLLFRLPPALYG